MIHARTLHSLEFDKITSLLTGFCLSQGGKELASRLAPFNSRDEADAAITLYKEFLVLKSWPGRPPFTPEAMPDVRGALGMVHSKAQNSEFFLELEALWIIRQSLAAAKNARAAIEVENASDSWPNLLRLATDWPFPEQLFAALCRCIADDGLLKDESSPELYRIRQELRKIHQNCLRRVKDFAGQYNLQHYLQDDFMTLSSDRYVLPLKANFKGRVQGIIHDWSQTGETCYFEPIFLVEINNRLQELKHEERQEEKKILRYLTGLLADELSAARSCQEFLNELDLINAKSKFAEMLACEPLSFTPESEGIDLEDARHPILALGAQNPGTVKPVSILLRPGEKILIITGGNAGGKTVCLKSMGLIAAMAMSGLPAPVQKGSHLPWFERVDAFIGDEQSIDDNVSTFTAQIEHLAKAWKHLNGRGLVLLDEFGAGTDPAEGAALAQAVLDGLLEKNCFALAATHFPALKSYALTKKGVRAASMLFNPNTGQPLFHLAYDQIGSSQALIVAQKHGLPESIIARARHYLLQDGEDSSRILERLNSLAADRERELADLRAERKKELNVLEEKKEKLDRERKRLAEDVRQKIAELMADRRENRLSAKQTIKSMSGLRQELGLENGSQSVLPAPDTFQTGQKVFNTQFNKSGIITDIDERRKRARLDMNGVGIWAEMKDLRAPGEHDSPGRAKGAAVNLADEPRALTLDVRGQRAQEAVALVEKFLDKALLSGFSQVEIVHGRGTGALRREIHEFLRGHPAAKSLELAPEDRGGDGMTIVNLA